MSQITLMLCAASLWSTSLWGHAFPEHAVPAAGAQLTTSPAEVVIHFDRRLEGAFSSLQVLDAQGRRVDRGDALVDSRDRRILRVSLPRLAAGVYQVRWTAVGLDGHRAQGDYRFTRR